MADVELVHRCPPMPRRAVLYLFDSGRDGLSCPFHSASRLRSLAASSPRAGDAVGMTHSSEH
jgi:hypothetical protein